MDLPIEMKQPTSLNLESIFRFPLNVHVNSMMDTDVRSGKYGRVVPK